MTIRLYNTASRQKEELKLIEDGKVGIYVCGVTVYDLCHIGHARSTIIFDVLVRYMRARGLNVTYVRNFTDVDDKIIARANELGMNPLVLAQENIEAFYEDMGRLDVLNADIEPKATEHIEDMIRMIETLIAKGYAYAEDGNVYYSVEKLSDYGALSGRKLEDMKAGSRIAVDEKKRHPMDFALWKAAKPGEPEWPSQWGAGRPGWHIECSVMSNKYLGETFDIHGGGRDLLFPHHENERAQSIAANGKEFAQHWVHNGFVTVESEKMSKSLGNFITIRDALKDYPADLLRLFLLSKHYRSPLDFARKDVLDMHSGLVRIYRTLQRLEALIGEYHPGDRPDTGILSEDIESEFLKKFVYFMDDDLNTAGAVGLIFEKVKELNRLMDGYESSSDEGITERLQFEREKLLKAGSVLGILDKTPADFFNGIADPDSEADEAEIDKLVQERFQARRDKNWARADEIRDQLQGMGVILEDGVQGTTWRIDV